MKKTVETSRPCDCISPVLASIYTGGVILRLLATAKTTFSYRRYTSSLFWIRLNERIRRRVEVYWKRIRHAKIDARALSGLMHLREFSCNVFFPLGVS